MSKHNSAAVRFQFRWQIEESEWERSKSLGSFFRRFVPLESIISMWASDMNIVHSRCVPFDLDVENASETSHCDAHTAQLWLCSSSRRQSNCVSQAILSLYVTRIIIYDIIPPPSRSLSLVTSILCQNFEHCAHFSGKIHRRICKQRKNLVNLNNGMRNISEPSAHR